MPGSPKKRQRRQALQAAQQATVAMPRAKATDQASRQAAVTRAAAVGTAQAAQEYGVRPSTIRGWKRRLAAAGEALSTLAGPMAPPASPPAGGSVEDMRATQALAQRLAAQAAEQSVRLMAQGNAVGVRELAGGAKMWSSTASALASAIAIEEASSRRLSEAHAKIIASVLTTFCSGLRIPLDHRSSMSSSVRAFLAALLSAAQAGDDLEGLPGAAQAGAEVRRHFARELRPEIIAELRVPERVNPDTDETLLDEPEDKADEDVLEDEPEDPEPAGEPAQNGLNAREDGALAVYRGLYLDPDVAERELARDKRDGRHTTRIAEWNRVGRVL